MDRATETQLSLIRELADLLGKAHLRFWLRGGWALDFHAGRVTRPHKDVDLITWTRHRARLRRPDRHAAVRRMAVARRCLLGTTENALRRHLPRDDARGVGGREGRLRG